MNQRGQRRLVICNCFEMKMDHHTPHAQGLARFREIRHGVPIEGVGTGGIDKRPCSFGGVGEIHTIPT
jgi:hypothetical protein